jgi:hypothetical protein
LVFLLLGVVEVEENVLVQGFVGLRVGVFGE